jgi:hypothetical protein
MRKVALALIAITATLALTGNAQATVFAPKPGITDPAVVGWGVWKPVPSDVERAIGHTDCIWKLGDTTYIVCKDGFMTSS